MLSRVFFRPRPLGISKTFTASATVYPDFPGIWQVLAIGGGGGGSGSDTFYGRYGVAGYPGTIATGPVSFTSSRAVTVGIGGGGGIGDSAGGQPGGRLPVVLLVSHSGWRAGWQRHGHYVHRGPPIVLAG